MPENPDGTAGATPRVGGRLDRLVDTATTALLAICALMTVAGLVLPSGRGNAEDPARSARSHRLTTAALPDGAPPDRLVVPSIGLDAPLVPIEVDQQAVLTPPTDVDVVGWWQRSAHPGQRVGQTVLTGHTVHTGGGVMDRLGDLDKRAVVRIFDDGRRVSYDVTKVAVYSTEQVAEHAMDLFGQERRGGRLVLVTCTDWNGVDYDSNIIVFGKPVDISRRQR